jgi:hypothetical protein
MISYSIKSVKMSTDLDGKTLHQWKTREPKRRTRSQQEKGESKCGVPPAIVVACVGLAIHQKRLSLNQIGSTIFPQIKAYQLYVTNLVGPCRSEACAAAPAALAQGRPWLQQPHREACTSRRARAAAAAVARVSSSLGTRRARGAVLGDSTCSPPPSSRTRSSNASFRSPLQPRRQISNYIQI